jgi:lipoprotein Spr
MQIKTLLYNLIFLTVVLVFGSCTTLQKMSNKGTTGIPAIASSQKPNVNNDSIEFLENLSVTPGKIYVKNASIGIEETDPSESKPLDKMPDNLSEVEKANWLQLKYSILMDVPVESISNIALLKKIDEWIGTPYVYGGGSKNGVDCSYFALDVMQGTFNIKLNRTAAEQYLQSKRVDWNELKEGDLIFFKTEGPNKVSHVGIYLTNNKFVHASTSQGVTISDLADPYWQRRLYSLGRVSVQ